LSPSSSLPLLAKSITHPAARSLCDSWASCSFLLSPHSSSLTHSLFHSRSKPYLFIPQIILNIAFSPSTGLMSRIRTMFQIICSSFCGHAIFYSCFFFIRFYSASALLTMLTVVIATDCLSVCLSVCPFVTFPVFCLDEWIYDRCRLQHHVRQSF